MLFAASLRAKAGAAANAAPSGMAGTLTASAPTKGSTMNEHGEEQMEPSLLCACKHANPGSLISGELLENAANADTSLAEIDALSSEKFLTHFSIEYWVLNASPL